MPLPAGYYPNYFSIDDILATQERISCTFLQDVPKLGQLNPTEEETILKSGTTLELPMWLALEIATTRQPLVTPSLPKVFNNVYSEILKADPCAVDLHKFGSHFYDLGFHAKQLDTRGVVADVLLETFTQRFRRVMDLTDVTLDPSLLQRLDSLEKGIFKSSNHAKMKLASWLMVSEAPLEAATMVTNHKKRKRVDDDLF